MNCPICLEQLAWLSDFMCDEVHGCSCEKGVVGFYNCWKCKAHVEITTDCQGE